MYLQTNGHPGLIFKLESPTISRNSTNLKKVHLEIKLILDKSLKWKYITQVHVFCAQTNPGHLRVDKTAKHCYPCHQI